MFIFVLSRFLFPSPMTSSTASSCVGPPQVSSLGWRVVRRLSATHGRSLLRVRASRALCASASFFSNSPRYVHRGTRTPIRRDLFVAALRFLHVQYDVHGVRTKVSTACAPPMSLTTHKCCVSCSFFLQSVITRRQNYGGLALVFPQRPLVSSLPEVSSSVAFYNLLALLITFVRRPSLSFTASIFRRRSCWVRLHSPRLSLL